MKAVLSAWIAVLALSACQGKPTGIDMSPADLYRADMAIKADMACLAESYLCGGMHPGPCCVGLECRGGACRIGSCVPQFMRCPAPDSCCDGLTCVGGACAKVGP